MFDDFEALKTIGLLAAFVVMVVASIVVGVRDARRRRFEREALIQQHVELLRRARAEAEAAAMRQRNWEAWARRATLERDGFEPSAFVLSPPAVPATAVARRVPARPIEGDLRLPSAA